MLRLVTEDGTGNWADKALKLGAKRSRAAVEIHYRTLKKQRHKAGSGLGNASGQQSGSVAEDANRAAGGPSTAVKPAGDDEMAAPPSASWEPRRITSKTFSAKGVMYTVQGGDGMGASSYALVPASALPAELVREWERKHPLCVIGTEAKGIPVLAFDFDGAGPSFVYSPFVNLFHTRRDRVASLKHAVCMARQYKEPHHSGQAEP